MDNENARRVDTEVILSYENLYEQYTKIRRLSYDDDTRDESLDEALDLLSKICNELFDNELNKSRFSSWASSDNVLTPIQISKYYIHTYGNNSDVTLELPKLLSLCYYCQGYYLSDMKMPMFKEPIFLTDNFISIKTVEEEYDKKLKGEYSKLYDNPRLDQNLYGKKELFKFLNDIWDILGEYDTWKLKQMIPTTSPYKYSKEKEFNNITMISMYLYFRSLYNHNF